MSGAGRKKPSHSCSSSTASSRQHSKNWEVMDDIQAGVIMGSESLQDISVPGVCESYLMKKRKWPLKGWHKRYFVLDKGILHYAKTQQDMVKGKLHGVLDVSLAVLSINKKSKRFDLDAGDSLYHMKTKSNDLFYIWVTKLCVHRTYKKNEAIHSHHRLMQVLSGQEGDVLPNMSSYTKRNGNMDSLLQCEELRSVASGVNSKVSAWLQQTQEADCCSQELSRCQTDLQELNQLVHKLHSAESSQPYSSGELRRIISVQNIPLEKPKKKFGKMWGPGCTLTRVEALGMPFRRISKSLSSSHLKSSSRLGASVPSIPDYVYSQQSPQCSTSPEAKKILQDICNVSHRVHMTLQCVHEALTQECQRLHDAWAARDLHQDPPPPPLATLCTALSEPGDSTSERCGSSLSESTYYDASDGILCGSSSENEASDESCPTDGTSSNSELEEEAATPPSKYHSSIRSVSDTISPMSSGHRTTLPAPCPDNSHIGLMAILYNNIGKDLSRVSMPAALNEPISLLQRLCEELEYSELLDLANHTEDPYERMVYIAAFAISGYATARYRSRYKPFNPILGETYECICEDRGFRFISEQVSHHPPVSACHAESENFSFWQDQRWKNKFWGKSLEIVPTGHVNATLPRFGEHYVWNKVVTCIHNVLSQQRYLEHYGEVNIHSLSSSVCSCKVSFVKSRYWGQDSNVNEVQGVVVDQKGKVIHRFGGLWHEGIFCDTFPTPKCIWKPHVQPKDHFLYYGFSHFAMELNELTPELKTRLPPTDTRLRPDQRMLEEGKVSEADKRKDEVEDTQRERRKLLAKKGEEHVPRFFRKSVDAAGREVWLTNGNYWKIRKSPGFANVANPELW